MSEESKCLFFNVGSIICQDLLKHRYTYLDDVGERHNVEFIAGKNTGFHVKTPFPDSNPRAYGPLYFRGRGRPLPRGRTSIQRGLDGSYKYVLN